MSVRERCPIAGGRHVDVTIHSGYITLCASDVGDPLMLSETHAVSLIRCLEAALRSHRRTMAADQASDMHAIAG